MLSRSYGIVFFAISGLLFAFDGISIWAISFVILGIFPSLFSKGGKSKLITFIVLLFIGISFFLYGNIFLSQLETKMDGTETTFHGSMITKPQLTSSMNRMSAQIRLAHGETVQVFYSNRKDPPSVPKIYDQCSFSGSLERPQSAKNPSTFNYSRFLYEQKIQWIVRVSPNNISCSSGEKGLFPLLSDFREHSIDEIISKNDLNASALITAIVFGDRSFMNEDRIDQYRQLGILHLLAVSGLHVGIVTLALYSLICRVGFTKEIASMTVFFLLPFYMFIAGGAPSVVRASLMCMLLLVIVRFRLKIKAVDVISFVCLFVLIIDPFLLYHLGFQLSFMTSFALILSKTIFQETSRFILLAKVTMIAQLISLPLSLYHFFEFSIFTLPVNLAFIPFISFFILPLAFLTVIFHYLFPPFAEVSYWVVSKSLVFVEKILSVAASPSWSVIVLGRPSNSMLFIMFVMICISMVLFERKAIKFKVLACFLIVFSFSLQAIFPYLNRTAEVTMLDVGQGDAIVIELPYRKGVYLIDTGGFYQWGDAKEDDDLRRTSSGPGRYAIEPFLKAKGIRKIDRLILTHGHLDHLGETCYLSDRFELRKAMYPKSILIPDEAKKSLECLVEDQVPIIWTKQGLRWEEGEHLFYVMNPRGNEVNENDQSIVIFAKIYDYTFIFTGDIESAGERQLINDYPTLQVDVLKVAHHGSNTSTNDWFISEVKPKIALIPVGENNRFGHPHPKVIDRLENNHVAVYRTDFHGAITMRINKNKLEVYPTIFD